MENPRIHRMRRHASLHPRLQRHQSSLSRSRILMNNKSNPYVGWFRHAPSTGKCTSWNDRQRKALQRSPYVGWFRHSPPTRFVVLTETAKRRQLQFEQDLTTFFTIEERRKKLMKVDGFLRGGSPSWLQGEALERALKDSSVESPSATIQVLSRLASWFLFPVAHDQSSCGYLHHEASREEKVVDRFPNTFPAGRSPAESDDEDESCSLTNESDQSDESSILTVGTHLAIDRVHSHQGLGAPPAGTHDLSVSSLAAAYYAHQAAEDFDRSLHSPVHQDSESYNDGDERLDFVITQMDIARMARNASRHLDVESILSLPTMTYHKRSDSSARDLNIGRSLSSESAEPDGGEETGSSWMIVPPVDELKPDGIEEGGASESDRDVCVICLEQFQEGDRLRVLPCSHSFHVGCIDRWLSGSHSFDDCYTSGCPTCKKRPAGEVESSVSTLDGSVPSWAFARLGDALASKDSSPAHST